MKLRCLLFWTTLVVAILAGSWWVLYVPYKPDSIMMAIPSDASFVSLHSNLAPELPSLLENRLLQDMLIGAGIKESDFAEFASNRVARAWISRLARDRTVIAYVPALGYQQKPAWIIASWIGNESRKLRWKLFWFRPKMFHQTATEYGRTIYGLRIRLANANNRISIALVDGAVLGCLSEDPTAARYLVQAFDRQFGRTSIVSDGTFAQATSLLPPDKPHWGWVKLPRGLLPLRDTRSLVVYGASARSHSNIDVWLALKGALPRTTDIAQNPGTAPLLQTLGTSPDCMLLMPVSWLQTVIPDQQLLPLWANSIMPLFATNSTPSLAFVSILNREYSGRIRGPLGGTMAQFVKGLRVPTILLGVQVQDAEDASRRISSILDRLNSRYGLGLIAHPVHTPNLDVTIIEESHKNIYKKFEPDERVAWAYSRGWMFLASNAAILKRLMAAATSAEASPADPRSASSPPCAILTTTATPADASLWINAASTGQLIKDAVSAAMIALMVSDSDGSQTTREKLETVKQWAERAQAIRDISASANASNGVTRLNVTIRARHAESCR